MAELGVLATSKEAVQVAKGAELRTVSTGDSPRTPVIFVATNEDEVELIPRLRKARNVVGVVAYNLPETLLAKVLELDIPVLVGAISAEQAEAIAKWDGRERNNSAELERARKLAEIEKRFTDSEELPAF